MPKKKKAGKEYEPVECESLSIDEVEQKIEETEKFISDKTKIRLSVKEDKKASNAAFNEQLKELEQDLEHYSGVRDKLKDHQKRLFATPDFAAPQMPITQ